MSVSCRKINKSSLCKKISHFSVFAEISFDICPYLFFGFGYFGKDGKVRNLLAEGRLVNLAAGDGHPAEIMDMSFAIQALSLKYILDNHENMKNEVINVPEETDKYVAGIKLKSLNTNIDILSEEQKRYINSSEG